jgi:hypothetical protein
MAIYLVTGSVGGGKSLYCVEKAVDCLKGGGIVHSNLDWNADEIEPMGWAEQLVTLSENPQDWKTQLTGGTEADPNLLIIEEAALLFHVRNQGKSKNEYAELFELCAMSRHVGLDLYFISQDADNVEISIRRMANYEIRCVAVGRVPVLGPMIASIMGDFRRTILSAKKQKPLSASYHRFKAEIAKLYKTHAPRGAALLVKQQDKKKPKQELSTLKRMGWGMKLVFALFAVLLYFGYQKGRGLFNPALYSPSPKSAPSLPANQKDDRGAGAVGVRGGTAPGPTESPQLTPTEERFKQAAKAAALGLLILPEPKATVWLSGTSERRGSLVLHTRYDGSLSVGDMYYGLRVEGIRQMARGAWLVTFSDSSYVIARFLNGREREAQFVLQGQSRARLTTHPADHQAAPRSFAPTSTEQAQQQFINQSHVP